MKISFYQSLLFKLAFVLSITLTILFFIILIFSLDESRRSLERQGEERIEIQEKYYQEQIQSIETNVEAQVFREEKRLDEAMKNTLEVLALVLASSVWELDQNKVNAVCLTFMKNSDILAIYVEDELKNPVGGYLKNFEEKLVLLNSYPEAIQSGYNLKKPMKYWNRQVGVVTLFYTKERIRQLETKSQLKIAKLIDERQDQFDQEREEIEKQIREEANTIKVILTITGLTTFLLIVSAILLISRQLIIKPLKSLGEEARQLAQGNLDISIKPLYQDEIGQLSQHFAEMRSSIRKTIEELNAEIRTRVQVEEELKDYQDHLEALVKDRTHELETTVEQLQQMNQELRLAQEQLIHSAKLASLGEMATGIAHELNQPLFIVSMTAENLIEDIKAGFQDELQEGLLKIIKQVERSSKIIMHLRTFGRQSHLSIPQNENLNLLVEESFILLSEQLRIHGVETHLELNDSIDPVRCNKIQIEQVLTNLIVNARDAMKNSSIKILTVRTFQNKDWVTIEVEDTGGGIEDSIKNKIFTPFFTTKETGEGTGLGLSISYGIIQAHQGKLEVTSMIGEGATFRMVLPKNGILKESAQVLE